MKYKIYLDDERTPNDNTWIVVRNYDKFVDKVKELGLDNIGVVSFDHDLGKTAEDEYNSNVMNNGVLDYDNIEEKTGYDAAKWLVGYYQDNFKTPFPKVYIHSFNPIGASNILKLINNFLKFMDKDQTAELKVHPLTVENK